MQPTPSQTIGPFFHLCLPEDAKVGRLAGPGAEGEALRLICRVLDADGVGVDDSLIELWQADASGVYNHPDDPRYQDHDPAFPGFARAATDENGECTFETVRPGAVQDDDGALHASHINVSIFARGLLKRVVTRIYFEDDSAFENDPVLASVPRQRRETLLARRDSAEPGIWRIEIHLSGARETVFFAL
jgi:protocatechuate 3,4-dioxygenase, alpha subunit